MNDNALFTLVRGILMTGLAARGLPVKPTAKGWDVVRNYQPRQQGANVDPTVYLDKIGGDRRVGSPQVSYLWDEQGAEMGRTESQQYASTFQASVLMDDSTNPAALTSSDAANIAAAIMQSDEALEALNAADVGIHRVTEVRNPYDANDRGQYDANPSFDFVLTYRRTFTNLAPHAVSIEPGVHRV